MGKTRSKLNFLGAVGAVLFLGSCATVNFDYVKTPGHMLQNTEDTSLGKKITPLVSQFPGKAGFHLLDNGIDGLTARLLIANEAERSIDAQYFLINDDMVGFIFIGSLLKAADRGVRVRLLLDDIQTQGYDAGLGGLDSHPNFEVRIYNPFAGRSSRVGDEIGDFTRINRRMHNKSFTADNQITLIGGRNIAAEYFGAREDVNFADLDVLGIGPVVNDVSEMFDIYWNSRYALPVPAFAKMPKDPQEALKKLRARIQKELAHIQSTIYGQAVKEVEEDAKEFLKKGSRRFTWAPYTLVYDSPDKTDKKLAKEADSILTPLGKAVKSAQKELLVISPYFVIPKDHLSVFQSLRDRGVEVKIVTNSLAANNHSSVHSGYVSVRKPLIKMGAEIYEYRNDTPVWGAERGGVGKSRATMHTKAFIVDRKELFVGSFNWDPRSAYINTELGVIIQSPYLAEATARLLAKSRPSKTYQVVLTNKGKIRWIDSSGDQPVIFTKEPDTGFWRRFGVGFMRMFPIKGQL